MQVVYQGVADVANLDKICWTGNGNCQRTSSKTCGYFEVEGCITRRPISHVEGFHGLVQAYSQSSKETLPMQPCDDMYTLSVICCTSHFAPRSTP